MLPGILKWSFIVALLLALASSAQSQMLLLLVACAGVTMVTLQARFAKNCAVVAVCIAVAVPFNPLLPPAPSNQAFF